MHWVATVATMTFLAPAQANQNDARLPGLFDQLREARSIRDAAQVEQTIWQVWLLSGNLTADAHVHRGLQALSDGRNEDALVDFTKATEVQADFAEAWNKRATVNYLLGRYDAAVLDIQKTLELEPRHFGALSGLGLINLALGREREALRAFEAALRIHPFMPGAKPISANYGIGFRGRVSSKHSASPEQSYASGESGNFPVLRARIAIMEPR